MLNNTFFYSEILREISGGVIYVQSGKILYINPAATKILEKNESDLLDKLFAECFFEYNENDDFNQMLLEVIYDSSREHEKVVAYFTGTQTKHLHIHTSLLKFDSESVGIIILFDDVTELLKLRGVALDLEKIKAINLQLSEARDFYKRTAETDKLTGLLNKITFENNCREYLQNISAGELAALFMIDLDNFKKANDTYGHQFGDLVLKNFADKLRDNFTTDAVIGRFGGDEFVILLKNVADINFVTDKARAVLEMARSLHSDKNWSLSASVGISIIDGSEKNYSEIFAAADKSVYVVKSQGRNGFSVNEAAKQS
ncbi:MAG: diguanylate cyclase [Selenomonadaceae bacterium]|nr:diguanylate cyclase [Selenomonadaceae bacterium]